MMVMYLPVSLLNLIEQTVFELESQNGNVDERTNKQTNQQNYTNFERNLAMMVMYLPVKFKFDWTNRFRVRVRKQKYGPTDGQTNRQNTDKRTDRITPISKGT